MGKFVYFFTVLAIISHISCNSQDTSNNFGKKSTLKIEELFSIKTDGRLILNWNGKEMICWDCSNNVIKKFNFRNKSFYGECKTEIENYRMYSVMVNIGYDSLVCYSFENNYNLKLLNYKGKVLRNYYLIPSKSKNILQCEKKRHPSCFLGGTSSNTCFNNYFYYAAYNMGENKTTKKLFSGGSLNIKNGSFEYFTEFPSVYNEYNWGAMYHYFPYMTINGKKELIVSYPASHKLYVYNLVTGKSKSVNAGSSKLLRMKPFSQKKELLLELKGEYEKYYYTNYVYANILYDKVRELYYRIMLFPKENFGKKKDITRKKSLIVLDKVFNFVGEVTLPIDKNYNNIIVTDYGLVVSYNDSKNNGFTLFKIN